MVFQEAGRTGSRCLQDEWGWLGRGSAVGGRGPGKEPWCEAPGRRNQEVHVVETSGGEVLTPEAREDAGRQDVGRALGQRPGW